MMLSGILYVSAQNTMDVWKRIASRDTTIQSAKKSALSELLRNQIEDYELLSRLLSEEIDNYSAENKILREKVHNFMVLTSSDTTIFRGEIKDITEIPACLKEQTELICCIIDLKAMIISTENLAWDLEQKLGKTPVAYTAIAEKLEPDLNKIQELIRKIKRMPLSTLSEEQQQYFNPGLTDRYDKFSKYFE